MRQLKKFGFEFDYGKKRLGKSKPIFQDTIGKIEPFKSNGDYMFVNCKACGVYMDFEVGKNDMMDGFWSCPSCKTRVRERTAYNKLNQENEEYLISDSDTDDDIPEYCQVCGGPYPDCQISCKLFDD